MNGMTRTVAAVVALVGLCRSTPIAAALPAPFAPNGEVRSIEPRPAMRPLTPYRRVPFISVTAGPGSSQPGTSQTGRPLPSAASAANSMSAPIPFHRRPVVLEDKKPATGSAGATPRGPGGVAPAQRFDPRLPTHRRPLGW